MPGKNNFNPYDRPSGIIHHGGIEDYSKFYNHGNENTFKVEPIAHTGAIFFDETEERKKEIAGTIFREYLIIGSTENDGLDYVGIISRFDYNKLDPSELPMIMSNKVIIDKWNERTLLTDYTPKVIDTLEVSEAESVIFVPLEETVDILLNPLPWVTKEEKVEKKEKIFLGKREMNMETLFLLISNQRKFWDFHDAKRIQKEIDPIPLMIRTAIMEPGQFDEYFCVEVDKPESPLMRKYLLNLASLVNKGLEDLMDEGIEDYEKYQKEAYSKAGYKGKTFETVIEEQKDYDAYFRFLLTRFEKITVTEQEKDYFDEMVRKIGRLDKPIMSKKCIKDHELYDVICSDVSHVFRQIVPTIALTFDSITVTYFMYIDDMHNVEKEIENNKKLRLEISLNNEMLLEEFKDQVNKKGKEFSTKIFVIDNNLNYTFFLIKKQTLNKWKKELTDFLQITSAIYVTKRSDLPIDLVDFTL